MYKSLTPAKSKETPCFFSTTVFPVLPCRQRVEQLLPRPQPAEGMGQIGGDHKSLRIRERQVL